MKIDSFKELQKLIKLCRTTGIEAIEIEGLKMNLGPTPTIIKQTKRSKSVAEDQIIPPTLAPGGITEEVTIPTNGLTDEQLLYWSAQGQEAPVETTEQ